MSTPGESTRLSVYAALIANLLIAVTKFVAAAISASSAMLSEAFHSLVDTGNEALLLYGQHRARRKPDRLHPLGYGRELYFWSFVVAVLIFSAGAGLAIYEGVGHILRPVPIRRPIVNYAVLAISLGVESVSWWIAYRNVRAAGEGADIWRAITRSKDPAAIIVLLEDSAAIVGILIALAGTLAVQVSGVEVFDGAASIAIGILLGGVAIILARESKGLLIGEPANSRVMSAIRAIAEDETRVRSVDDVFTVHLGPDQIVAILALDMEESAGSAEAEDAMRAIDNRVVSEIPGITAVFFLPPQPRETANVGSRATAARPAPNEPSRARA